MNFMETYEGFLDKEKKMFAHCANLLLSNCFLSKDKKDTKDEYYFVLNYKFMYDDYFRLIGWELIINQDLGAIQLYNAENKNLLKLKKTESIILILLRILYQEKISSIMSSNHVMVKVDDIHQKYDSLEFKKKIYKTDLIAIIRMFRRFNLIEPLGDVTKGSCDVIIYPTILLAVNNSNIDVLYNIMKSYEMGEVAGNEEANEDSSN